MAPCFSDLPAEALDEIARRVGPLDNVTCSAVCKPWRRALNAIRLGPLKEPAQPHRVTLEHTYQYLSVTEPRKTWTRKVRLSPGSATTVLDHKSGLAFPTRIIGCSFHGWLVLADDARGMSLLDPLTGRRFRLPPIARSRRRGKTLQKELDERGEDMFQKAVLAPGRRLGTFAVMLVHSGGRGLSFLAPGARHWTTLREPAWAPKNYLDVVSHKGAFYTVSLDCELNAWVPDGSSTGVRAKLLASPRTERAWAALVESKTREGLFMVSTHSIRSYGVRGPFQVSRYDEREGKWVKENRDKTKFLVGHNGSFCVSGRGVDEPSWYQQFQSCWFLPYAAPEFPSCG